MMLLVANIVLINNTMGKEQHRRAGGQAGGRTGRWAGARVRGSGWGACVWMRRCLPVWGGGVGGLEGWVGG